jgi:hypothetical protein
MLVGGRDMDPISVNSSVVEYAPSKRTTRVRFPFDAKKFFKILFYRIFNYKTSDPLINKSSHNDHS